MKFLFLPWNTDGVKPNFLASKPNKDAKKLEKYKYKAIVTPWVKDTDVPLRPLAKLFDLEEADIERKACNLWADTFDPECEYDFTFVKVKFSEVTHEYSESGDYMVTDGIHFLFFTLLEEK